MSNKRSMESIIDFVTNGDISDLSDLSDEDDFSENEDVRNNEEIPRKLSPTLPMTMKMMMFH